MISYSTDKQLQRWYQLLDVAEQVRLVEDMQSGRVRFPVVPAGRRSGKTERFKRFVVKEAMRHPGRNYFAGAPTRDQAKRIFWKDLKTLSISTTHKIKPYETDLILTLPNEATISIIGFDKPERFEGQLWHGGGVDECGNLKEKAINENILPALNTFNPLDPDYKAWCWFFGVPEGLNHYYDLAMYAKNANDPEWDFYTWFSSEVLPESTIIAEKKRLSSRQFKQEYEASFETAEGKIYDDYNELNHTKEKILPHEELMWMHDQNFTPLSSAISVVRGDRLCILDEIVLTSAISKQSAIEFCVKYEKHDNKRVLIYGDPAGRAGEKHGHESDYTEMEGILKLNGWDYERRVARAAPAIRDRQNATRAMICNGLGERRMFVNPEKCVYVDKGFSTVQTKKGSAFQEDQSNEFQHITTAVGYMVNYEYPINTPMIDNSVISFNN